MNLTGRTFLTANWNYIVMCNFQCDPEMLMPYLPAGCELATFEGEHYISLVAFQFHNTTIFSLPVPFHRNFNEVNLRFYVKHVHPETGELERGVVFIKEFVTSPLVALTARTFFKENYHTAMVSSEIVFAPEAVDEPQEVSYSWHNRRGEACVAVQTRGGRVDLSTSTEAAFFSEHYLGFTRKSANETLSYRVRHEPWDFWQLSKFEITGNWEEFYNTEFSRVLSEKPRSVFLFDGSPVTVSWRHQLVIHHPR